MIVSMIAAVAENNVIGKDNDLPWHLPDDMKYFMQTTKEHYVVMGRKNYQSIPEKFRPLPNRTNIVVTSQKNFLAPGCHVVNTLGKAIEHCRAANQEEIFLIGGSRIYQEGLSITNKLYLTEIKSKIEGDVFFPKLDKTKWKEISRVSHPTDERHKHPFDFVVLERQKSNSH